MLGTSIFSLMLMVQRVFSGSGSPVTLLIGKLNLLLRHFQSWRLGFLGLSLLAISGCATMQPQDFAHTSTHFQLDRYFVGHARSWGVFEDTHGEPRRTFVADSYGKRDAHGDVVLAQHFRFSDGKTQMRVWHIHRDDATHWEATANDVIGVVRGEGIGNAFSWQYTITLDRKNPLATVHVSQWMYQPEGTDDLMTRLVITKFGMTAFEVTEVIHHLPAGE